MKILLPIALLVLLVASCSPSTPKDGSRGFDPIASLDTVKYHFNRPEAAVSKHLHAYWDTANGSGVYCEDTTLYSMDFVRCLRSMGLPNLLEIKDGAIHGESSEPIPIAPILADTTTYYFKDPASTATLVVRRIGLTSIQAHLSGTGKASAQKWFDGRFVLGCGFILGAESDDGEDGAYFVDEYWSSDEEIAIRIGVDGDRLAATVRYLANEGHAHSTLRLYEGP